MCSIKQGIRSTKKKKDTILIEESEGSLVAIPLKKYHNIYVKVDEAKETIYTDQMGAFPVQSRSGNRYIMIMCEMDSNSIISKSM